MLCLTVMVYCMVLVCCYLGCYCLQYTLSLFDDIFLCEGITNTVGRVLTGFLANTNKIDALIINNIAMVVCSLATFFTPFCYSYELLCLASALFGFCVGQYIVDVFCLPCLLLLSLSLCGRCVMWLSSTCFCDA